MIEPRIISGWNAEPERFDLSFLLIVLLLCGLGMVTLYSASMHYADRLFGDSMYFIKRQGIHLLVSIMALVLFSFINLDLIRKLLPYIILGTLILCVLPFIPGIGITKNGASRWFGVGPLTFQPSELVKMVIVLYLAHYFTRDSGEENFVLPPVLPPAIVTSVFVSLVYMQNDFSTSFFIMVVALTMFFMANIGIVWFLRLCAIVIPLSLLMILTREYRLQRVLSFIWPNHDPLGAGYQVNASVTALSEAGIWGRGMGNGVRKISSIPEVQSDFIFAVWAEEMGFIGVILFFVLIVFFAWRGYRICLNCSDRFRALVGFGAVSNIVFQTLINSGVVARVFPATGVTLPFFSSGGSSLLITLCLCGIILNVSRYNNQGELNHV